MLRINGSPKSAGGNEDAAPLRHHHSERWDRGGLAQGR